MDFYECFAYMYYVYYMHVWWPQRQKKKGKKRMSNSFVTEVTESYEPPHGCLGLNWGLLENQQELLTTETSLKKKKEKKKHLSNFNFIFLHV